MKIAVLGSGHGGRAMAADLTLAGHEVRLATVPEFEVELAVAMARGGIMLEGMTSSGTLPGFAEISSITTDVPAAVKGTDIVMVVVPAFGQKTFMDILVEHAEPGQLVVFNPGKFAALEFARMLREAGRDDVQVGETDTLVYATRTMPNGNSRMLGVKDGLLYAAFPSVATDETLALLHKIFPQFVAAPSVLATSMDDNAMSLHTVSTLLNTSRIEIMGPYKTGHYDCTPSVGRVMLGVDEERRAVAKRLGNPAPDFFEIYEQEYGVKAPTVHELLHSISAYDYLPSPDGLHHRYITEEVPYALVPTAEFGRLAGVPTPGIDGLITIASMANETDYWTSGRSLRAMGLEGLDVDQVRTFVTEGAL